MDTTTIPSISKAGHIALPFEPIDRQRHRSGRDPHVARKIVQRHRIYLVQVVEHARLVSAERSLGLRVSDVPRVAGEENSRIER